MENVVGNKSPQLFAEMLFAASFVSKHHPVRPLWVSSIGVGSRCAEVMS
jgi:hypothetical protein